MVLFRVLCFLFVGSFVGLAISGGGDDVLVALLLSVVCCVQRFVCVSVSGSCGGLAQLT